MPNWTPLIPIIIIYRKQFSNLKRSVLTEKSQASSLLYWPRHEQYIIFVWSYIFIRLMRCYSLLLQSPYLW